MEKSEQLARSIEHDMSVERVRVGELTSLVDTQKLLVEQQADLIHKHREHIKSSRSRLRVVGCLCRRLKRELNPMRIEVKNLRETNGVLHQRFMASTFGAIVVTIVAAGYAAHCSGTSTSADNKH